MKHKLIAVANIILLIASLLIGNYSEIIRGENPLYASLKMLSWGLLIISVLGSFINTLLIFFEYKKTWKSMISWVLISLIPMLLFLVIEIIILTHILINKS